MKGFLTNLEKMILENKIDYKLYPLNEDLLKEKFKFNLLGKRKLPNIRLERLLSRLGKQIKRRYGDDASSK